MKTTIHLLMSVLAILFFAGCDNNQESTQSAYNRGYSKGLEDGYEKWRIEFFPGNQSTPLSAQPSLFQTLELYLSQGSVLGTLAIAMFRIGKKHQIQFFRAFLCIGAGCFLALSLGSLLIVGYASRDNLLKVLFLPALGPAGGVLVFIAASVISIYFCKALLNLHRHLKLEHSISVVLILLSAIWVTLARGLFLAFREVGPPGQYLFFQVSVGLGMGVFLYNIFLRKKDDDHIAESEMIEVGDGGFLVEKGEHKPKETIGRLIYKLLKAILTELTKKISG